MSINYVEDGLNVFEGMKLDPKSVWVNKREQILKELSYCLQNFQTFALRQCEKMMSKIPLLKYF